MSYHPHPQAPGYWQYDGLPVQADVETHQFAVATAKRLLSPGARILDVGAGRGALTKALLDQGFALTCTSWNDRIQLPVSAYRIDLDRPFGVGDVGGQVFDMVCAIEVIEHCENPAQLLRSIAGLVQPGALAIVSTPNVESATARLEWLTRGRPYMFDGDEISHNRHITILWKQGLEKFFDLAGFDILERHAHGALRYANPMQRLVKAPVHALMRLLFSGDLEGNSRTYLLKRNAKQPRSLGAEEVL